MFDNIEDLFRPNAHANLQVQYKRARHHDSKHGRRLQRDPFGTGSGEAAPAQYADGMNLYEYAQGNPIGRQGGFHSAYIFESLNFDARFAATR